MADPLERVLVVVPCLNEAAHLPALLRQLAVESHALLIVVADGGSSDNSRALVADAASRYPGIRLLDNPARLQSAGINAAVRRFGADKDWLVRVDAHCLYPQGYVRALIETAQHREAQSVVVPMLTRGEGGFQCAAAAAQNSLLGTGGSAHRHLGTGRFVDHGHHALMDLALFRRAGGYDESFSHNEDAELDLRLAQAGGRIWLEPSLAIGYFPRRTPLALIRQYAGYGRGRARTLQRHRARMKLRQAIPVPIAPMMVAALMGVLLAALQPWAIILATPAIAWAVLCNAYGVALAVRARRAEVLLAGGAAMLMHLGWSWGFWSATLSRGDQATLGPRTM